MKAIKDRGKRIIFTGITSGVNCMNGFEVLEALNEPPVALKGDPC